ncbi:hypothetical protein Unana1_04420 [Umbelopsis nana]
MPTVINLEVPRIENMVRSTIHHAEAFISALRAAVYSGVEVPATMERRQSQDTFRGMTDELAQAWQTTISDITQVPLHRIRLLPCVDAFVTFVNHSVNAFVPAITFKYVFVALFASAHAELCAIQRVSIPDPPLVITPNLQVQLANIQHAIRERLPPTIDPLAELEPVELDPHTESEPMTASTSQSSSPYSATADHDPLTSEASWHPSSTSNDSPSTSDSPPATSSEEEEDECSVDSTPEHMRSKNGCPEEVQFYITVGYLPADYFAEGVVPFIAGYHIIEIMCHLRNGYGATDQDATMTFYLVLDAVATPALDPP